MYRTGDLARFRDDGRIEYIGRVDNQVKIRGFRIELGEIEARMREHPAVREAVVVTHEDRHGDAQLVAYVVAAQNVDLVGSELRDYLKQKLPHFMVPAVVSELATMPLTPNGKVDRRALPKAPSTRPNEQIARSLDPVESELVEVWERILGVTPIGLTEDFFELGGHSLQAVRMFAEVEEKFERSIPLATLFEAGTIEKLAALLRQDGWHAPESSLVPIQPLGNKPPFFCIHAKGGNVLFYKDLARHLGTDQPFYGLQARRLAGRQVGHDSVEEMAAFYIKEIKSLQPVGPYYIGGASFGGLAAFEMAQQLRELGDEVAMLALLDTGTPDYPQLLPTTTKLRSRLYSAIRRYQHHRDSLKLLGPNERLIYVQARLKKVRLKYRRRLRDKYRKTIRQVYARVGGVSSIPKKYLQIEDQIWKAGRKYEPRPYDGKVTLFLATLQPLGIVPDRTLGWGKHVNGEIEIHEVPGHHGAIVAEPFVRVLAEKLGKCIERTLQRDDETGPSVQHSNRSQQRFEAAHA
jgi:thioesterase domain-containing protein/acyl carrier protein